MSARTKAKESAERALASNRQAFHNYFIGERYEAGVALLGTEVKSLREGKANLKDSFARVDGREVFLHNCHISPYSHGGYANHDPLRPRKLLLHREEILKLAQKTRSGGETLVPLRLYLSRGRVKVEIALARGKRSYDKRAAIASREAKREVSRALKEAKRG